MQPTDAKSHGTQPPPPPPPPPSVPTSHPQHPQPRRVSPENSVTLRHHQLAREASLRANRVSAPPTRSHAISSPRRDSSGESHETGQSDAKKWFDQSNQNPTATFDSNVMDVDPPFFQRESDSSNEDKSYPYQQLAPAKLNPPHSSSADDYRSVIDDLTVEIQKLKEELKRYKQKGPEMLRKEKLFEIKIHGLPKRKRRELETTLRDFAASLGDSPDASSSQRKKSSRHATRDHMYSGSGSMSMSKHASSSSGSNARPVDSAYASMSIGANSSGTSLNRPQPTSRTKSSDQKVENYLRDIPEGLYPRHMIMTEKEKKKLVVRRLEQIFTGKIAGRHARRNQLHRQSGPGARPQAFTPVEIQSPQQQLPLPPPPLPPPSQTINQALEASREARILPLEHQSAQTGKKSRSQDMGSASNSNGDQTESGGNGNGNGNGSGSGNGNGNGNGLGTNPSPSMPPPPEQRPTRPKDLDPDRVQIPSENMEYIRHLGLIPPELITPSNDGSHDVHADADGWVYLNLLCNMAQLHIMNVTPDFVRVAVTEMSAKFQLSPDGRKIRWRGGTEGTRFSSDSSGDNSQRSPETDDTEVSKNEARKRQKTAGRSTGDDIQSGSSGKNLSNFRPQVSGSSESFHYKPLFVHNGSPGEQVSVEDDTLSSFGPVEESNGESRWNQSGSGASNRRKRRHDGAIIYYSGAPFCTDLSGDPGDASPVTYMLSSGQERTDPPPQFARPLALRSESGSSLVRRPLSDVDLQTAQSSRMEVDGGNFATESDGDDDDASEFNWEFPWCNEPQFIEVRPLEPCGLGGVLPEDHFMVIVTTKRSKQDAKIVPIERLQRSLSEEATEGVITRLATMSTSSPRPMMPRPAKGSGMPNVEVEYVSGRIKRLAPVPLPPPAIFFPPFSMDSWSEDDEFGSENDDGLPSSEEFMSRQANPHQSDDYPDGVDLSSGDEDGEDLDDEADLQQLYAERESDGEAGSADGKIRPSSGSTEAAAGTVHGRSNSASAERMLRPGGSSAATVGGVDSGSSDDSS